MKKAILLCGMLLALTASIASAAQGVNMRWSNCLGDGGLQNRNFACNTNVGGGSLRGSFELDHDIMRVSGVEPVVDLATASPVLPEWWEFKEAGTCRSAALSIGSYDGTNCFDWALLQASMNIAQYQIGALGPNTARIKMVNAVVASLVQDLLGGLEYTCFNLGISNTQTVNSPCTGCQIPACIVFNSINVATADLTSEPITGATDPGGSSFWVTYQGGGGITVPGRPDGCPQATPTKNRTWSQVKSLYR